VGRPLRYARPGFTVNGRPAHSSPVSQYKGPIGTSYPGFPGIPDKVTGKTPNGVATSTLLWGCLHARMVRPGDLGLDVNFLPPGEVGQEAVSQRRKLVEERPIWFAVVSPNEWETINAALGRLLPARAGNGPNGPGLPGQRQF